MSKEEMTAVEVNSESKEEYKLNPNVGIYRSDVSAANKIKTIFGDDPEVDINFEYGDIDSTITIFVNNSRKAFAISKLLPKKYEFGCNNLIVNVEDTSESVVSAELIKDALAGNPHFKEYKEIEIPELKVTFNVFIFNKEVIQFLNDNAMSLHGYEFTLMENLAKEMFATSKSTTVYTTDDGIE